MNDGHDEFRQWLTFCLSCAGSVPDALDPKAASILRNVRDTFDKLCGLRAADATPPAPNDDLRAALERLNTAVEHDEYLDGVRIDHGDALQILAALKENRRG